MRLGLVAHTQNKKNAREVWRLARVPSEAVFDVDTAIYGCGAHLLVSRLLSITTLYRRKENVSSRPNPPPSRRPREAAAAAATTAAAAVRKISPRPPVSLSSLATDSPPPPAPPLACPTHTRPVTRYLHAAVHEVVRQVAHARVAVAALDVLVVRAEHHARRRLDHKQTEGRLLRFVVFF